MADPQLQSAHLSIERLWAYRTAGSPVIHEIVDHLYTCEACLAVLGLCQIVGTLEEAESRYAEWGRDRSREQSN